MNDDEAQRALVKSATEVGVQIAKDVYGDTFKGSMKAVGEILYGVLVPFETLAKAWNGVWRQFQAALTHKLKNVPAENIREPPKNIAYPLLQAYPFTEDEPELRDLFEQLLASSMNSATVEECHPAFVEMLKQLTGDDARIMRAFQHEEAFTLIEVLSAERPPDDSPPARLQLAERGPHKTVGHLFDPRLLALVQRRKPIAVQRCIDNLERLGLLAADMMRTLEDEAYREIYKTDEYKAIEAAHATGPRFLIKPNRGYVYRSALGSDFVTTCIGPSSD
ncbi:MAG: Uncharacterized protein JWN44_2980 [Myxococcales bacterium]|nr:Uncharacterized protein [Myxococcales bacterium]